MAEGTIERRHLLRGAGIVAGGAVTAAGIGALASPAVADDDDDHDDHDDDDLTGSWLVQVRNEDGSTLTSVGSFAKGGVAIIHDINPAGPPFTGSWKMRDDDRWRATVWSGFPGQGGPGTAGGTVRLRLRGVVDGRRIRGSFRAAAFTPDGSPDGTFDGTFTGRRIEA
jgi:hypothetical protein